MRASGTKMPVLSWKDFCDYDIPLLDEGGIKKFNSIGQTLIGRMQNNIDENATLTEIRDTLLPKLMSGEINLNKVEI